MARTAKVKSGRAKAAVRRRKPRRRPPVEGILAGLRAAYPEADCALLHDDPFQLLAATILSAQCTDAMVNRVTPGLFRRWPDAASLAAAPQEAVEAAVHSTGFFRNKAKNLRAMAAALGERHGGEVPRTMEELTALPGVARKTANVLLGTAFGIADGVVVDTHVGRIARRLGMTAAADPVRVERDLQALLPREEWVMFSHRVIHHGRRVCTARAPRCGECTLAPLCPSAATEGVPPR